MNRGGNGSGRLLKSGGFSVGTAVIIPAHEISANLVNLVWAIERQKALGLELFVSLDRSAVLPEEQAWLRAFPPSVTLLQSESPTPLGPAQARNRGARAASAENLLFVDSDVLFKSESFALFCQWLDTTSTWDVATVRFGGLRKNLFSDVFLQEAMSPRNFMGRMFFPSAVTAIRSSVFWEAGGFDEAFPAAAGEDWELLLRLHSINQSLRMAVHEGIVAKHQNPRSIHAFLRRSFRYGLHAHRYLTGQSAPRSALTLRVAELLVAEFLLPISRVMVKNTRRKKGSPRLRRPVPRDPARLEAIGGFIWGQKARVSRGKREWEARSSGGSLLESMDRWLGQNGRPQAARVLLVGPRGTRWVTVPRGSVLRIYKVDGHLRVIVLLAVFLWRLTHRFGVLVGYLGRALR